VVPVQVPPMHWVSVGVVSAGQLVRQRVSLPEIGLLAIPLIVGHAA
jgi:hypothetical protein